MGSVGLLSDTVPDENEGTALRAAGPRIASASIGGSKPTSPCGGSAYAGVSSFPVRTVRSGALGLFERRLRTLLVHLAAKPFRSRHISSEAQRILYGVGIILSLDEEGASGLIVAGVTRGQSARAQTDRECSCTEMGAVMVIVGAGRHAGASRRSQQTVQTLTWGGLHYWPLHFTSSSPFSS